MSKRSFKRYTKRLEAEFSAGGMTYRGISSNLSIHGLFIRTHNGFVPGTEVEIRLQLPDGTMSDLKGIVKNTVKMPMQFVKNGMGIEILEADGNYENFLKEELLDDNDSSDGTAHISPERDSSSHDHREEYTIIPCQSCSVKNRVKTSTLSMRPKCGKCGASLT
jgi:hypothetical protein